MVSFGFEGKDYLAISIETRKEKGESYSTLAGFFRQYELYYVVADERDVIRVRTTYRQPQEDVYIYRMRVPQINIRRMFLDYIEKMNHMHARPRFYNTLTTNCTTTILMHTRIHPESPPMSWKVLLSGYVPDYLYELGRIDTTKPFADLEKLSRVNERAHAADQDAVFLATHQARAAEAGTVAVVRKSDRRRHRALCSSPHSCRLVFCSSTTDKKIILSVACYFPDRVQLIAQNQPDSG